MIEADSDTTPDRDWGGPAVAGQTVDSGYGGDYTLTDSDALPVAATPARTDPDNPPSLRLNQPHDAYAYTVPSGRPWPESTALPGDSSAAGNEMADYTLSPTDEV